LIRSCKVGGGILCSVLIQDGRVASIGDEPPSLPEGTKVIEANGGSLFPGFIDSHCHPFEYGWLKRSVDLRGVTNITGLRLRLQAGLQRTRPGEWVTGMGWDQETFPGKTMPSRLDIDDISPSNPVALARVCGHVALVNSRGIAELGLDAKAGDEIETDEAGKPTGIVKEGALTEVFGRVRKTPEMAAADLQSVEAEAARLGLTALHCVVSSEGYREELAALALLDGAGSLSLRYRVYIPIEALDYVKAEGWKERLQGDQVRINGVKIYADGSLGARTAALLEPYSDDPRNQGMLRYSDDQLSTLVQRADASGYQVIVHAIGDRAVEQAVGALSQVTGTGNPRRHRIEHASLLPKDLMSKMAKRSIRATVQPLFVTSDTWATERLGEERVRDLYPFRSMLAAGIITSGSSDSPVESLGPVLGMWAAMTRGGSSPEETLSLEQALALYTANAAANGFDGGGRTPKVGDAAELTLLDSDTGGMHPAMLRKVGVLATVIGGSVVHCYDC
jgi:predicted amidohydrolase YtcJ